MEYQECHLANLGRGGKCWEGTCKGCPELEAWLDDQAERDAEIWAHARAEAAENRAEDRGGKRC